MFQQAKDKLTMANEYRKTKLTENTMIKAKFAIMDVVNSTIDYVGDISQTAVHYW